MITLSVRRKINGLIDVETGKASYLALAYLNSWFIGVMVLFVPQGLGVRESVFSLLARPMIPGSVAVTLAAGLRLLTIMHDIAIMLAVTLIGRRTPQEHTHAVHSKPG
jgi:uncharacterized membrane protein YbhN (UPF0104 family)